MSSGEDTRTLTDESENENDRRSIVSTNDAGRKCHLIEPILFFLTFSSSLFEAILPNAIEVQYCTAVLDINDRDQCLDASSPHANELQTFVSRFSMYRSFVELLIPGLLSFFLGPWSDMFGRKPLMLSSSIGFVITFSLWTWGSSVKSLHPSYFISFSIPLALAGGPVMLFFAMFCYACDVTTIEERGARLGFLQACTYGGSLFGTLAAPYLVKEGYTIPFGISAACVYITLVFLYFLISESVTVSEFQRNSVSKNPFQLEQLKSLYQACYVKQTSRTFLIFSLVILLTSISLIQVLGEMTIFYLFLQHILGWTLTDYTPLSAFSIGVSAIGSWLGCWFFMKFLKLPDLLTLAIATFARVVSALLLMFGTETWHIYVTKVIGSITGVYGPVIRVFLSRIIAPEDLGKVFCLLGSLESFTPLIGSLLYNGVYQMTIVTYPRAVFLLSCILSASMMNIVAFMVKLHVRPSSDVLIPQTSSVNA